MEGGEIREEEEEEDRSPPSSHVDTKSSAIVEIGYLKRVELPIVVR